MSSQLLDQEEYIKKAEELVNSIGIPSQPSILTDINREINRPGADLTTISDIVSKDVALAAKLLKVANSPFFGLKEKVDSIQRALSLLGLKSFQRIILASAMRESFSGPAPAFEKFWNHSMATASVASHIAGKVEPGLTDQAYIAGLFHDCGIPLLMKKYPEYAQISDYALSVVNTESLSGKTKSIIGIEDERYATHHCAVGYIVAKSWRLSIPVCQSIWYHHYVNIDIHGDVSAKRLTAIMLLADYLSSHLLYLGGGACPVETEQEWARMHKKALFELALSVENVKDLKEDFTEKVYG